MSDLSSSDTIVISGITKFAIPVIAFFIVRATKDIVSQWLDNQRIMFTATQAILSDVQKEPLEQNTGVINQSAPQVTQPIMQPVTQAPTVASSTPRPLIIDNYSQSKKS